MEEHLAKPQSILPSRAAPLRTLTVTMAVMCYLACLAIGGLLLINRAVEVWTSGLSREVTVQVRQISNVDIEQQVKIAGDFIKQTPGIVSVEALDKEAGAKLLEPWLGNLSLDELPIPRLLRVTVDEKNPPDFDALSQMLADNVKGASLDTHRRWEAELTRTGTTLSRLAYMILALICLASIMLVVFAARSVLEVNRRIVEILELVGAKNSFIARLSDWQFLKTGLFSGLIGVAAGLFTFYLLSISGNPVGDKFAAAGQDLLFSPAVSGGKLFFAMLTVPIIATLIAVITSRLTLMRMLGRDT